MAVFRRLCHFRKVKFLEFYLTETCCGCHVDKKQFGTREAKSPDLLWEDYARLKDAVQAQPHPAPINPDSIFTNNELDLADMDVYGFDYDYTLASYKESLHHLLYSLGTEALVTGYKYPAAIKSMKYDPQFAVRGLHFDVHKGFLMKIDAFHNIQLGTVYKGLEPVPDEEVIEQYQGTHVPVDNMSGFHGTGGNMVQLMDMFALPEITLMSNVIQYFIEHSIAFDPGYVFYDVKTAVQNVHKSGELHASIMDDLPKYLEKEAEVSQLMNKLSSAGKKLLLITNSGYAFYPAAIKSMKYDPQFAVRGLHFDVHKGFLMKIDAFHNIQLGTVYRGLEPVPDEEVIEQYQGTHVPVDNMSGFHGTGGNMVQLMDMFALPEITLMSNVIQYFIEHSIAFDPGYVFYDVKTAVQNVHKSGELHASIMSDLPMYLEKEAEVSQLMNKLSSAGKKLLLITNSGYAFVDKGMSYMLGSDWSDMFDVIITRARKPQFFRPKRPFRSFDRTLGTQSWGRVTSFEKGQIYQEGNMDDLQKITGWHGAKMLYFGDHVYTDLADATLSMGWRTGAIIPELEGEIKNFNSEEFTNAVTWLSSLQDLIEKSQVLHDSPEAEAVRQEWLKERDQLRVATKEVFNPRFGSLFRTYHNPTYFSRRLSRFADIYMSSLTNLLNYKLTHTFYPRRAALPHEVHYGSGLDGCSMCR
ncbi:5'-nucleotidase domain-containing protein 3 [Lingula anatina]|uniref:5'-nucleotidase domain-containing protein 3 n=2 Tax=Lingula anatina TaxID=7574 RepID=A0A2R2MQY8_LINAN|nr:5'-nucleotidase domain-containing protein 3 [Lingula anatina]|eukprot:XP_023932660.1 5'-nucleotidase domain-containing protein 3 [Lingula anatina]